VLSQTSEYALRALTYLASEPETPRTGQAIARKTQVPPGYLAKVLQQLAKAGLVRSQRGVGGGFVLARPPGETSILAVLNAVDPIRRIDRCPLSLPEHARALCALHRRLDDAFGAVEASFRDSTIGDLVRRPQRRGAPPAWPLPAAPVARRRPTKHARRKTATPVREPRRRTPWK
jgi:Rrf2 family protein